MDATTYIHTLQKYLFKIGLEETLSNTDTSLWTPITCIPGP